MKINSFIRNLLVFELILSKVLSQVTEYNQCGGIGYNGPTQCSSGLICQKNSDWWSMCVKSMQSSTKPSGKITTQSSQTGTIPKWGTCGSVEKCMSGLDCYARSIWYSQCLDACPIGQGWDCEKNSVQTTTKKILTTLTTLKSSTFFSTKPFTDTTKSTSTTTPNTNSYLITEKEFSDALVTNGYAKPNLTQYKNLVSQASSKGGINTKLHLAMFLTHAMWESDGLKAMREYACYPTLGPNCAYSSGSGYPGQSYFGRGYFQLSWDYNYRAASQALYGSDILLRNPDKVAADDNTAWATAFWFWKTNVLPIQAVQNGYFGSTTNAINGALECRGAYQSKAKARFAIYKKVLIAFSIKSIPNESGCYN